MAESGGLRGKGAARRADCPVCGRSTAVTWNKATGDAYYRSHHRSYYDHMQGEQISERCDGSRQTIRSRDTWERVR